MFQTDRIILYDGDGDNSKNKENVIGEQFLSSVWRTFLFSLSLPSFTLFFLRPFFQYFIIFLLSSCTFLYLFLSIFFLDVYYYFSFLSFLCLFLY
jgi:hypothetical protein